ncbi:MAG: hypothetical protein ABI831_19765, partial [Betaproteobacteria bacterium]
MKRDAATVGITTRVSAIGLWVSVTLAVVTASGCASWPQPPTAAFPSAAAAADRDGVFSAELAEPAMREAAFDEAWRLVHERFYDSHFNGVDWEAVRLTYLPKLERVRSDNQFYALITRMVGELRDSHTRAYNANEYRNRMAYVTSTFGIHVAEVDGEIAIIDVLPES